MKISPLLLSASLVALAFGVRAETWSLPDLNNLPEDRRAAVAAPADDLHPSGFREDEWVELLVDVGDRVSVGQKIAIQRNALGQVVQEYAAGVSGEVAIIARHALPEPGNTILEILIRSVEKSCANGDCQQTAGASR